MAGDDVTATSAPPAGHPAAVRVGLLVAAAMVVLDQATKELAERVLEPGRFVSLIGEHVGWQLVYNPGGAFGLPAPSWLFLGVTVIVTVIVLRNLPRTPSLVAASAYGLLLAGALGNVLDRLFRPGDPDGWPLGDGYVVDFVAWGTFPRFNVADSAITVGFVLLLIALWQEERHLAAQAAAEPDPADPDPDETHPDDPDLDELHPVDPDPDELHPGELHPGATHADETSPDGPDAPGVRDSQDVRDEPGRRR